MSSYDVTLSSATRQNLLSLQDTSALTSINQNRLSTGKKVNSALDNPVNFFTAQNLTTRASSLTSLLDGISNGIQTIQGASKGITSITSLVNQLQSTITQAQSDAAQNHPTVTGTAGVGSAGNVSTSQSGALSTSMTAASGIAMTAGDTLKFTQGTSSFTYTAKSTDTVQDFVNAANNSGVINASVDSNGKLTLTGVGASNLVVSGTGTSTPTTTLGNLGLASSAATLTGTGQVGGTTSSTVRSTLVSQFNSLTSQIDSTAADSGYNGTNLLGGDNLDITFNEKTGSSRSHLNVGGQKLTSASLGITQAVDGTGVAGTSFDIQDDADLSSMQSTLKTVLSNLQSLSSNLGSSLSVVQNRQDFTKNISDVLQTGADNLTNADMNAEAANSQALSTRQSLGISALSLANTANQGILQLLR